MTERNERTQPTRQRPRRSPRFVLPDVHHDERTDARIEAFLDGPAAPSRGRGLEIEERDRPRRAHELDTRPDWTAALRHEASRHARYGRPASVVLIEIQGGLRGDALDRVARRLGDLIRAEARETDRTVRAAAASFRMLLPETNARAARHVATRVEQAFRVADSGRPQASSLRIEVASPTRGGSLEDAIQEAERRLAH